MTDYSKIGLDRQTSGSKWYYGQADPSRIGLKAAHIHVLPLGFPRLAILQAGRGYTGGSVTTGGYELAREDR